MKRFALAFCFLAVISFAQDFSALEWRNIGPNRGGRSIAIAGSVQRPNEYYFGATGGGLWKTTDGGNTWGPVTDGKIHSSSVGAVAVAESNPDVVYLGMGETELRASILLGDGMYKSTDAGKTWRHIGLEATQTIARIRIHPTNPDIVWVAALGHPYGASEERGVFRTKDGGTTWQRVLYRGDRAGAIDLALDPHDPNVLYASIWDVYRKPWLLSSGGPASGLFRSTDGGDTWQEITRNPGLPQGVLGKICVSVSGADSRRVYATVEADDGGVFRSDDAGATWQRVNEDRALRQRAFYYTRTYADPKDRDTVYVLNVEFFKSTDGGKTFRRMQTAHSDHHDLWIAANDPQRMAESDDGGGSVSVNGGRTWTREEYPTAQFYHVATTVDVPYHVCGAQQDDGTACVISSTGLGADESEGGRREVVYSVAGGEAAYIAPSPANPNIFFSGTQAGLMTRFDRASGETRDITVYPLFFSGMAAQSLRDRWQWVFPIVLAPLDPRVLYASSQHLWRSTNEGQSWQRISPDLTRDALETLGDSGGPITKDQNGPEIYGTIYTVALSPRDPKLIWTGSDDGLVHVTVDGGEHWAKVTPPGLPEFSRISMIEASWMKPGTAYVAAKRYELDDLHPLGFRTDDYGKTWTAITSGIASNDFLHVIREDPQRPGLLYAGAEHGVYVSFDDGAHWRSLSLNLPDTPVVDLAVKDNDLVIATHGRSFWVLDDVSMLRQWTPEISRAPVYLYIPATAIRGLRPARIEYTLAQVPEHCAIEITTQKGAVVRSYPCRSGTHRIVWNLTYPGAVSFPGLVLRYASPNDGPVAPPGAYGVRLIAGAQTIMRPLAVLRDPRVPNVSDADLERQFQLAMKVRDAESQAHQMVMRIREINQQIRARKGKLTGDTLAAAGQLETKLSAVEESLYQVRNRSPRDTLNYPIQLNNQLAVLQRIVSMGNYPPTDQQEAVFRELAEKLGKLRDDFQTAIGADLQKLNAALESQKIEPIL